MKKRVLIASDHGGFELKTALKVYLEEQGQEVEDLGADVFDPADDYPDYVLPLIRNLRQDDNAVGVLVCRSAQGVAIAANRNPGVRAAIAWNEEEAKKSREHNDTNVLCLSGDQVDLETNKKILKTWLNTDFSSEPRHTRRLHKIESYFPL